MHRFLLFLLSFMACVWSCAAQVVAPVRNDTVMLTLDRAVVIADSKPSPTLQSTPLMVKSRMEIEKLGLHELYEVVKNFNGIQIRDYGGIGGVKTVSVRSMGSQHTAVNYDGVTMSNTQSGQIDIGGFNLDNVSMVTMTIGLPDDIFQTARYFSSVGILTIKTMEPVFHDKGTKVTAMMRMASFKTYNPGLRYEQRLGKNFSMSLNADWLVSDGTYPFTLTNGKVKTRELRLNSDVNTFKTELNLFGTFKDGSRLTVKGNYLNSERGLPGPVVLYNMNSHERLWNRSGFIQTGYEKSFGSQFDIKGQLKYSDTYDKYQDKSEAYEGGVLTDIYRQREYYLSASCRYRPSNSFSFTFAEDFFLNTMDASLTNFAYPVRYSSLTALSGQYRNDRVTATANMLVTCIKETVRTGEAAADRFHISPSASVSYKLLDDHNLRVRASCQNIFRTPTFNDLYYAKIGNTKLKPEIAQQFNAGLTFSEAILPGIIDAFSLSADVYVNKVQDKIVAIPTTFISKMLNFGSVDIFGVDVSMNASVVLPKGMSLDVAANYSFQSAVDITSLDTKNYRHQIPYTPRHSGNASLSWLNRWIDIAYTINAVGERYSLPQNIKANRIDGYIEHNISLNHKFDIGPVQLKCQAECLNVTDCKYEVIQYYPMPGRTFRITMKLLY